MLSFDMSLIEKMDKTQRLKLSFSSLFILCIEQIENTTNNQSLGKN